MDLTQSDITVGPVKCQTHRNISCAASDARGEAEDQTLSIACLSDQKWLAQSVVVQCKLKILPAPASQEETAGDDCKNSFQTASQEDMTGPIRITLMICVADWTMRPLLPYIYRHPATGSAASLNTEEL